ncbi:hypothetical protein BMJ34_08070, partial [Sinorhizobium medicae]
GLLDDLKKALSERILNAELDDHLDVERLEGGPANRRNGSSKKTVLTGTSKMTPARSPSKPTKTGWRPIATSTWTTCESTRNSPSVKPHDQHA